MAVPAVSVVICVYNGASCVTRALDSALTQDFSGAEVIVVDDGSTDLTPELLRTYGDRIRVIRQSNRGLAASRNVAVAAADGPYIAFLDADDVWLPGRLAKTVAALENNPASVLAYSNAELVDYSNTPVGHLLVRPNRARAPSMDDLLEHWWPIQPSAVTIRRRTFESCGGFRQEYRSASGFEDTYLFTMAREHGPFEYIDEPLVRYRILPFIDRMEKYARGFRLFSRHMHERYGYTGDAMIRDYIELHSDLLIRRGMLAMGRGDLKVARRAFRCLLRYKPTTRRDVTRLLRTYLPRSIAVALTSRTWREADPATISPELLDDY
jgi:glycosyltransferase involved in cell wall biosynthesis